MSYACACATDAPPSPCATGRCAIAERPTKTSDPERPIEEALERLEAIADRLEDPALDLDEAVRLYEEGLRLYGECAKRLDATELRITELGEALARQSRPDRGSGG